MKYPILILALVLSLGVLSSCSRVPGPKDPKIEVWKYAPQVKAADSHADKQWGLKKVKAAEALKVHSGSSRSVIALVGTGVDYNHPDLKRNIWLNPGESDRKLRRNKKDDDENGFVDDVIGWDFVDWDNRPYDRHGIGTHSAGVISAVKDNGQGIYGVAPRASLMILRYIDGSGNGYVFDAIDALNYAIDNGAQVIYMNWSYGFARGYQKLLSKTFDRAAKKGIFIVIGAGNQTANVDVKKIYPPSFTHENLIVVGASKKDDSLAGMSNFGRRNVDIVAPGVKIYSALPGGEYGYFSGTATAAAHVTGAVALTLSYRAANMPIPKTLDFVLGRDRVDYLSDLSSYILSGGRLNVAKALAD